MPSLLTSARAFIVSLNHSPIVVLSTPNTEARDVNLTPILRNITVAASLSNFLCLCQEYYYFRLQSVPNIAVNYILLCTMCLVFVFRKTFRKYPKNQKNLIGSNLMGSNLINRLLGCLQDRICQSQSTLNITMSASLQLVLAQIPKFSTCFWIA